MMPTMLNTPSVIAARREANRLRVERRQRLSVWAFRSNAFGVRDGDTAAMLNMSATALSSLIGREMLAHGVTTRLQLFMTYLRMGIITPEHMKTVPMLSDLQPGDVDYS